MASSSSYRHHKDPSSAAPLKLVTDTTDADNAKNPNTVPAVLKRAPEDVYLSNSTHLTREEVLRRRSHNLKQLAKCYRDHYWALMEELRVRYREYVWKFGLSPFKEENKKEEEKDCGKEEDEIVEVVDETCDGDGAGSSDGKTNLPCAFQGCKLKAMALTSFCYLHILSDPKQQLYKPCDYVIQSAQAGPLTCGMPILRSTVPALCSSHYQKAQKHVNRALRIAGSNITSSNRSAPKLHVIVTEFVREIQEKRRASLRTSKETNDQVQE